MQALQKRDLIYRTVPPSPPLPEAITTITPALQQVARLLHASPYVAVVTLHQERAERGVRRLVERYPSAAAHRNVQSALRSMGLPSVRVVLMPPEVRAVTVLLLSNLPPDERESWTLALDPKAPLRWRNYEVATVAAMQAEADKLRRPQPKRSGDAGRITWRLSEEVRDEYRHTITRLIHSSKPGRIKPRQTEPTAAAQEVARRRAGGPRAGTTRSPEGAYRVLMELGQHLASYPGFNGISVDRWLLQRHMQRLWKRQHPEELEPQWPSYPYLRSLPLRTAPLSDLWPSAGLATAPIEEQS
jgi:hypothetical protein